MKKLIKKWLKLYDKQDIENAIENAGYVKYTDTFIWRFKLNLFKSENQ